MSLDAEANNCCGGSATGAIGDFQTQLGRGNFGHVTPGAGVVPAFTLPPIGTGAFLLSSTNNLLSKYGADLTGATDSTASLNHCLSLAGSGGACVIDSGAHLQITGNVTLPGHTTLYCSNAYLDAEDNPAVYATLPAIKLSSSVSITASGEGAAVINCLIYRNGMTFPATNSSAFAGTALNDGGFGNFTVLGSVIIGFDTAIDTSGPRPYIQYVYMDGNGSTHAVLYEHNGNSDGGIFDNIKIQALATGNYGGSVTCAAATRTGTGFYMGGTNFIGAMVSQNMRTAEIDIEGYTIANGLWADFPQPCLGSYSPTGVVVGNTQLMVNHLDLNSTTIGILNKSTGGAVHIGSLFLNTIGGDCIQLGTSGGIPGGAMTIENLVMNTGNASNCGGYVVNYQDSTHASYLTVNSGLLQNGGTAPYFSIPTAVLTSQINISPKIVSDLTNPAAIYGATTVGSCTGLGATGNGCALAASKLTDPFTGVVVLTVGSTGSPGTAGVAVLTWPLTLPNNNTCTANVEDGSGAWASPFGVKIISVDSRHSQLSWFAGSALTASLTYNITFNCRTQ